MSPPDEDIGIEALRLHRRWLVPLLIAIVIGVVSVGFCTETRRAHDQAVSRVQHPEPEAK